MDPNINALENIQKELDKFKEDIEENGFNGDSTEILNPILNKLDEVINNLNIENE